jgi:hypothetical protein
MKQSGFNPKARWDRNIPESSDTPQTGQLNEKIDCLAWFRAGKIYPKIFVWNHKEYPITAITYNWQERRGREVICCFSVSTGADLYQISFNNTSYSWQLDKIIN